MRRIVLLSLFAVFVSDASAQRGGGIGRGFGRVGFGRVGRDGFSRGGFHQGQLRGGGIAWLPYGSNYGYNEYVPYYDAGGPFGYPPQPVIMVQQPLPREAHLVIIDYPQPVPRPSAPSEGEPQTFGIVLKDGSTRS